MYISGIFQALHVMMWCHMLGLK